MIASYSAVGSTFQVNATPGLAGFSLVKMSGTTHTMNTDLRFLRPSFVETSPGVYNFGFGGYTAQDVGMPEWGNSHATNPSLDDRSWTNDPYRRCCTANAWIGQCLAMRIMNLQAAWNHPSFFDYVDRYFAQEQASSWTRAWDPWHESMWLSWRSSF